jgi:hypothetical protein
VLFHSSYPLISILTSSKDTGLSELLVPLTRTEVFNKSLEIQQSRSLLLIVLQVTDGCLEDLLASYEVTAQLNAIEDLIAQGAEMQIVLRLLCLASLTAGGVKAKNLESIKRETLQVRPIPLSRQRSAHIHLPQAYGYEYLPLLLSLAVPSLGVLLPNPLPPSTSSTTAVKYPFTQLRKSLRLLIDDNPDALDEVENDISFVYSGYAPISIRLVQCIAQKGGVISNPAEKEKSGESNAGEQTRLSTGKVQAHPIMGWKGFEDVVAAIPGPTVEVKQKVSNKVVPSMLGTHNCLALGSLLPTHIHHYRVITRDDNHGCLFPGWMHVHGDCCSALGGAPEQRSVDIWLMLSSAALAFYS